MYKSNSKFSVYMYFYIVVLYGDPYNITIIVFYIVILLCYMGKHTIVFYIVMCHIRKHTIVFYIFMMCYIGKHTIVFYIVIFFYYAGKLCAHGARDKMARKWALVIKAEL